MLLEAGTDRESREDVRAGLGLSSAVAAAGAGAGVGDVEGDSRSLDKRTRKG